MGRPRFLTSPFSVTYELNPPKSPEASAVLDQARRVAPFVDAFNLTDCPLSNLRMNPGPLAERIQTELGVATIPHITGRDRNVLAIQSELLAFAFQGIRHVFCLTGDPIHIGDHPKAKGVYELYANELIRLVRGLNEGRDHAGNEFGPPTDFGIGAAVTLTDGRPEAVDTFQKKLDAGPDFFQTQIILDPASLESAAARKFESDRPTLIGTVPIRGPKMLETLRGIPGIEVTEHVDGRLRNPKSFAEEANRLVLDLRDAIKGRYAGLHLMPIVPKEDQVSALLNELRGARGPGPVVKPRTEDAR